MNPEVLKFLAEEILGTTKLLYTSNGGAPSRPTGEMQYYTLTSPVPNLGLVNYHTERIHLINWKGKFYFSNCMPIPTHDLESITLQSHYRENTFGYQEHLINLNHPFSIKESKEFVKRWYKLINDPRTYGWKHGQITTIFEHHFEHFEHNQ